MHLGTARTARARTQAKSIAIPKQLPRSSSVVGLPSSHVKQAPCSYEAKACAVPLAWAPAASILALRVPN